jgi:hypothetical protein
VYSQRTGLKQDPDLYVWAVTDSVETNRRRTLKAVHVTGRGGL